jgi:hypothetical protein
MYTIQSDVSGRFAVTSDNFGRVMLLELRSFSILKVLKGYRNAQCAFLNVARANSGKNTTEQRPGLFIVVYAPLRGILECWNVGSGKRECALNVGLHKLLIPAPPVVAVPGSANSNPTNGVFHGTSDILLIDKSGMIEQIVFNPTATSTLITMSSSKNFGIFRGDNDTMISPVLSSDENSIQQFISIAIEAEEKDVDKLKRALQTFSSYSHVIKSLTSILSLPNISVTSHRELTEQALSILKENYSTNSSSKWESFQTWTTNRIQVLKAIEVLTRDSMFSSNKKQQIKKSFGDSDFELIEDFDLEQEWILATDDQYHSDIQTIFKSPAISDNQSEYINVESIVNSFNLYEQVIQSKSTEQQQQQTSSYFIPLQTQSIEDKRVLCSTFFSQLHNSSASVVKKALSIAHIRSSDLQELFLFWFMDSVLKDILLVRPSVLQKLIYDIYPVSKSVLKNSSKLHSSSTMITLNTILDHVRKTSHILNAALFLSLYNEEVTTKLETSKSELHKQIRHVREQLNDLLYMKHTLKSHRVQSTNLSIAAFEKQEVTLSQLLAREQVYMDTQNNKAGFTEFCSTVQEILKRFPLVNESESEEGVFIDKTTEDRDELLLFHCVIESAAIEHFDLSRQYLTRISREEDVDIPDYISCGLAVWDAFVLNHLAPALEYCVQNHTFISEKTLNKANIASASSFKSNCDFYKAILRRICEYVIVQEPEDMDSGDEVSSVFSDTSMASIRSIDPRATQIPHWPPIDTLLSDARNLARRRLPDSETCKQLIAVLQTMEVALDQNIADSIKVNVARLYSKKRVLLPILKKRGNISNAKMLILNSIKEPITRQSVLQKSSNSRSKSKKSPIKEYRLDFIRQLLEHDMLQAALSLTAQHDCFPSIDTDQVYLEALRIFYSVSKDEKGYDVVMHLNSVQNVQTKAKAGKILMEICSKRLADILNVISENNKSVTHIVSDMPPKLFTYMTHYMNSSSSNNTQKQLSNTSNVTADSTRLISNARALLEICIQMLAKTGTQSNEYQIACMMLTFIKKLLL